MMKNITLFLTAATLSIVAFSGCTLIKDESPAGKSHAQLVGTGNPADAVGVPGVPGALVPTGSAMILRIANALEYKVSPQYGNFAMSIGRLETNLPKLPNPLQATGADQGSLLAYSACTDVSPTNYSVNINESIALQKSNIIAAGKRILDRCTAGLATTSTAAAEVTAALTELVDKNAAVPGETTEMAWLSSCYTAVTVCTQFLGM